MLFLFDDSLAIYLFQVISNYRNGHTGQLSAVTVFLLAAGAVIRVFTSIQETGDRVVISTYIVSSAVNMLLLLQVRRSLSPN